MADLVYIETTIVSYLTSWPSNDVVRRAHEISTEQWWSRRENGPLRVTSELVLLEAARGDPIAAAARLEALKGIPILPTSENARELARTLIGQMRLPPRAVADALHVAICATERIPFLLTWNCKHLANGHMLQRIEDGCALHGLRAPIIVTPDQMPEDD